MPNRPRPHRGEVVLWKLGRKKHRRPSDTFSTRKRCSFRSHSEVGVWHFFSWLYRQDLLTDRCCDSRRSGSISSVRTVRVYTMKSLVMLKVKVSSCLGVFQQFDLGSSSVVPDGPCDFKRFCAKVKVPASLSELQRSRLLLSQWRQWHVFVWKVQRLVWWNCVNIIVHNRQIFNSIEFFHAIVSLPNFNIIHIGFYYEMIRDILKIRFHFLFCVKLSDCY